MGSQKRKDPGYEKTAEDPENAEPRFLIILQIRIKKRVTCSLFFFILYKNSRRS